MCAVGVGKQANSCKATQFRMVLVISHAVSVSAKASKGCQQSAAISTVRIASSSPSRL